MKRYFFLALLAVALMIPSGFFARAQVVGCSGGALFNFMTGGKCPSATAQPPVCPLYVTLVCGSNGITYSGNSCLGYKDSSGHSMPSIPIASNGACPVQGQPIVSVTDNPTLRLTYDSIQKESQLTASVTVKVTAGTTNLKIVGNWAGLPFVDATGNADNLDYAQGSFAPIHSATPISQVMSSVDQYGRTIYEIPAGTSAAFTATRTTNPQQMFAGAYYASLKYIYYIDPTNPENALSLTVPSNKTKAVTIVGELSPYITSVTPSVKGGDTMTILGVRLNWSGLYCDGNACEPLGTTGSPDGMKISFTVPATWTAGQHYIQVSNIFGMSNQMYFTVTGTAVTPPAVVQPTVTVVGTPGLALQYDSTNKESSLTAHATVTITAGSSDFPINNYMNFVWLSIGTSTSSSVGLNSDTVTLTLVSPSSLASPFIPAGTSATVNLTRKLDPQQMFAGSYITYVNTWLNNTMSVAGSPSSAVTIVGETSPYLSAVQASAKAPTPGSTLTIAGSRLSAGRMGVFIDKQIAILASLTVSASSISLSLPIIISQGQHSIQVKNDNGLSNILWFTVVAPVSNPAMKATSAVLNAFLGQGDETQPIAAAATTATANISPAQNTTSCVALARNIQYRDNDTLNAGEISQLQSFLQGQGYLTSAPTGYFGLETFVAVESFQSASGLKATGYVGALTRAKIQEVSCQ